QQKQSRKIRQRLYLYLQPGMGQPPREQKNGRTHHAEDAEEHPAGGGRTHHLVYLLQRRTNSLLAQPARPEPVFQALQRQVWFDRKTTFVVDEKLRQNKPVYGAGVWGGTALPGQGGGWLYDC